ncbi:hypothetical protein C5Y93_09910 [Blastopirellula marina]|uniref:Flagellar protein FliL n=1 Tax=Blastopirellula marina TaxID=124 RepID=A0A2S8GPD9_9BACT|nr:hypothetical protein C5Y93_09910 [Blastopirellula marina]
MACLAGCAAEEAKVVDEDADKDVPPHEIAIGEYKFRAYDPAANTQTKFEFTLAGLAAEKDIPGLETELEKKQMRIRDRVMIVSRESTIEELEDPDLVMFRRRLLKEVNRMFDEGELSDIYVSHFRVKTR